MEQKSVESVLAEIAKDVAAVAAAHEELLDRVADLEGRIIELEVTTCGPGYRVISPDLFDS
jgi:hypothetical protein